MRALARPSSERGPERHGELRSCLACDHDARTRPLPVSVPRMRACCMRARFGSLSLLPCERAQFVSHRECYRRKMRLSRSAAHGSVNMAAIGQPDADGGALPETVGGPGGSSPRPGGEPTAGPACGDGARFAARASAPSGRRARSRRSAASGLGDASMTRARTFRLFPEPEETSPDAAGLRDAGVPGGSSRQLGPAGSRQMILPGGPEGSPGRIGWRVCRSGRSSAECLSGAGGTRPHGRRIMSPSVALVSASRADSEVPRGRIARAAAKRRCVGPRESARRGSRSGWRGVRRVPAVKVALRRGWSPYGPRE